MRRPKGVEDLASKLTAAAHAPLVSPVAAASSTPALPPAEAAAPTRRGRTAAATVPLFLRVPSDLHTRLEAEAVKRTKATGKGVSVQQIVLEHLERGQ